MNPKEIQRALYRFKGASLSPAAGAFGKGKAARYMDGGERGGKWQLYPVCYSEADQLDL